MEAGNEVHRSTPPSALPRWCGGRSEPHPATPAGRSRCRAISSQAAPACQVPPVLASGATPVNPSRAPSVQSPSSRSAFHSLLVGQDGRERRRFRRQLPYELSSSRYIEGGAGGAPAVTAGVDQARCPSLVESVRLAPATSNAAPALRQGDRFVAQPNVHRRSERPQHCPGDGLGHKSVVCAPPHVCGQQVAITSRQPAWSSNRPAVQEFAR